MQKKTKNAQINSASPASGASRPHSGKPSDPKYADSAEALAIGDATGEVWIFHMLTGAGNRSAIWAAQRVPDPRGSPGVDDLGGKGWLVSTEAVGFHRCVVHASFSQ